jgi:hypothetical protein
MSEIIILCKFIVLIDLLPLIDPRLCSTILSLEKVGKPIWPAHSRKRVQVASLVNRWAVDPNSLLTLYMAVCWLKGGQFPFELLGCHMGHLPKTKTPRETQNSLGGLYYTPS